MFGLLVFVHEWGHLIFAKRAGMLAREFAIGFGPKLFSFMKNETVYTIRLLPIGGYVRVAGEDPEIIELKAGHHIGLQFNESGKVSKIIVNNKEQYPDAYLIEVKTADLDHDLLITGYSLDDEETLRHFDVDRKALFVVDELETQIAPYDRQFASKTVAQRAMQLFAGPMMNFILAIVIFVIIGLVNGFPAERALIGEVQPNSPAEEAGIEAGDEIVQVEGSSITSWQEFTNVIQRSPGQEVDIVVKRDNQTESLTVIPKEVIIEDTNEEVKIGQVGVLLGYEKSVLRGFVLTYDT